MDKKLVYKIMFVSQGSTYEVYAKNILQSHLLGFIEVDGLLFDETSAVLVDPASEKLKNEFAGVSKTYVPMQAVLRIDEVEKQGISKIKEGNGKSDTVTPFPSQFFSKPKDKPSE